MQDLGDAGLPPRPAPPPVVGPCAAVVVPREPRRRSLSQGQRVCKLPMTSAKAPRGGARLSVWPSNGGTGI